ncbi:MAG: nitrophenyl compound nitroreductase subunit ArsF family protein [Fibrobacterota bacterium]
MRITQNKVLASVRWLALSLLLGALMVAGAENKSTQKKSTAPVKPAVVVSEKKAALADTSIKQEARQLVVYYFMTSYRCRSCIFIESTTRKALDENYGPEQKSGRVVFKMVNIEEPQNKHFVDEYGVYTKSVVLSDLKSGKQMKWKNLDQVWNMIGQDDAFKAYIVKEVKPYLGS